MNKQEFWCGESLPEQIYYKADISVPSRAISGTRIHWNICVEPVDDLIMEGSCHCCEWPATFPPIWTGTLDPAKQEKC